MIGVAKLTLIQAVVPSADKVVTQGDVHEEIDVPCNLNVEDLKISAPFASTREHVLVFGGVTGTIANALERRQDVIEMCFNIICTLKEMRDICFASLRTSL